MALSLVKFPLEIQLQICEFLSQAHEPSLRCFALANKHCHSIASPLLFRTLTFNITTPSKLRAQTRKCTKLLQRDGAFRHVQRLVLVSDHCFNMHSKSDNVYSEDERDAEPSDPYRWQLGPAPSVDWDVNHQRLRGIPNYSDFAWRTFPNRTPVNAAYDEDAAWAPLADLIRLLPALTDLIYECPAQFPPCLLQALHSKICSHITRLHLRTFKLRMLEGDSAADLDTSDPHELALITSPSLYSIWLRDYDGRIAPYREEGIALAGRQLETLEQIIRTEGLAPNLREVRLVQKYRASSVQPCPYPSGWLPEEVGTRCRKQQPVALEHLELGCDQRFHQITNLQVQRWTELADLSALQTLELTALVAESCLDIVSSLCFPALTALTFRCTDNPNTGYFDKVKRFLAGLPRLESLSIIGWDWSVASFAPDPNSTTTNSDSITPAFSRTLRLLWLDHRTDVSSPYSRSSLISPPEIARLGAFCPRVETLSVPIRRSRGDADEAARYKAIGASFPRLKQLALTLDASPPLRRLSPRREDEAVSFEDQYIGCWGYTNGHFLDVMVNSAVDGRLARQIFEAVASPGLETMMVRAQGGGDIKIPPELPTLARRLAPIPNLVPFLNGLAREWIVNTAKPGGETRVKEIGLNAEGWKDERQNPFRVHPMEPFLKHFRRLWPDAKEGSRGWYDDWESWPLAGARVA